jgi:NADH dehydrogenase FAD-containing subunit
MAARHRVLIVGGGYGGLYVAKALRRAPVDVTLLDRKNTTASARCSSDRPDSTRSIS